ncbi:unnamed protein product [Brachionus calyciflorus]|uniref:Uncharacterized protein n=1 Tax=Brachionus calyciflorus TaxID=104777 RepID=A0A814NBF2_9BILA|nr:unnamed protein product [Brachionus calyciflorus]
MCLYICVVYGSHDKPDSVSSLKSPVTSNVKWTQETPERVGRDHLESFTVKPDLTRAWYGSANSGKCLNCPDFDSTSRQRSSTPIQSKQQQTVPLQILNENKYNTWSTNATNPFASTWCPDDATREIKKPVNPFRACDMKDNSKSDGDRTIRDQDFTAVTPVINIKHGEIGSSYLLRRTKSIETN